MDALKHRQMSTRIRSITQDIEGCFVNELLSQFRFQECSYILQYSTVQYRCTIPPHTIFLQDIKPPSFPSFILIPTILMKASNPLNPSISSVTKTSEWTSETSGCSIGVSRNTYNKREKSCSSSLPLHPVMRSVSFRRIVVDSSNWGVKCFCIQQMMMNGNAVQMHEGYA
jgi:hypothetical protein